MNSGILTKRTHTNSLGLFIYPLEIGEGMDNMRVASCETVCGYFAS